MPEKPHCTLPSGARWNLACRGINECEPMCNTCGWNSEVHNDRIDLINLFGAKALIRKVGSECQDTTPSSSSVADVASS